jgi:SAM-dependent methyltransferase
MIECAQMLKCPNCGAVLELGDALGVVCACGARYPRLESGGLDFLQGASFADFQLDENDSVQRSALEKENEGITARIENFFLPLIGRYAQVSGKPISQIAVLDIGCGNGLSVDILRRQAINAWGVDAGRARHDQWRQRGSGKHLISANALRLPFQDASFDVVLSSGLIEHIGIHEEEGRRYHSYRLSDCEAKRIQFVREMVRMMKDDGFLLLDHPHGAFPADFWHGGAPGSLRWHKPSKDMLPRFAEIANYFRIADASLILASLSPSQRLTFKKVGMHWYGRVFAPFMKFWLKILDRRALSFMARSFLNPYLVTVAARQPEAHKWIYHR